MTRIVPIPAVDIRGGRCVQLVQGDFGRETTYGDDPLAMAQYWQAQGAERLHVVDLDGARDGQRANAQVIQRLIEALDIPVQVGGGIRSLETARGLLDQGADRVVVGTAAAEQPEALADWVAALGTEHMIVGVDARNGLVATHGWRQTSSLHAVEFCKALSDLGIRRVLYTDIDRDGMLSGPNVPATREVARITRVIASGGISLSEHLRQLADAGAEAAVIGTALYDGRLRLREAQAVAC
jgi:phosphoribosylformimino-5-aminoimidazole carboxamide ribotide isomerase